MKKYYTLKEVLSLIKKEYNLYLKDGFAGEKDKTGMKPFVDFYDYLKNKYAKRTTNKQDSKGFRN